MKGNTEHAPTKHPSIFEACYYSIFLSFPSLLIRKYLTELEAWWRARVATLCTECARVRRANPEYSSTFCCNNKLRGETNSPAVRPCRSGGSGFQHDTGRSGSASFAERGIALLSTFSQDKYNFYLRHLFRWEFYQYIILLFPGIWKIAWLDGFSFKSQLGMGHS